MRNKLGNNNFWDLFLIKKWYISLFVISICCVYLLSAEIANVTLKFSVIFVPYAPTNFDGVAQSSTSILWSWMDNASNEDGYQIKNATGGLVVSLAQDTNQWLEDSLSPNTSYYRYVEVYNQAGTSSSTMISRWSLANKPTGTEIYAVFIGSFSVRWNRNNNPLWTVFQYHISTAATFDGSNDIIGTLTNSSDPIELDVEGVLPNTTYYFRVRAQNGAGQWTGWDTEVSTKTLEGLVPPPKPTGFYGLALSTVSIKWEWNITATATYYQIYNSVNDELIANLEGNGNTIYIEINLSSNTQYGRYVKAGNAQGLSVKSDTYNRYTLAYPPESLTATVISSSTINLNWNYSGASRYQVWCSSVNSYDEQFWSNVVTINSPLMSYSHMGLIAGVTYYYWIVAVNGDNISNYDFQFPIASTRTLPSPVIYFSTSGLMTTFIVWEWTNAFGADGYKIYRATDNSVLTNLSAGVTYYIETNLSTNTVYERYVRAFNTSGLGDISPKATFYTLAAQPINLQVEKVTANSVGLSWAENGNPSWTRYEVSYSTDNFVLHFATAVSSTDNWVKTSTTVINLTPNTTYWFRVRAFNGADIGTNFTTTSTKTPSSIIISQFATRGPTSSNDEFVELYNPSSSAVDVSGWKLEYYGGTSWTTKLTIPDGITIPAYSFYLISSSITYFTTIQSDLYHNTSLGFADGPSGKPRGIRIVNNVDIVMDKVVYESNGNTNVSEAEGGKTAPNHGTTANNRSVIRKEGSNSIYLDTDNNYDDFIVLTTRNPRNSLSSSHGPDEFAPSAISNLTALTLGGTKDGEILLSWSSPGDDGTTGILNNAVYRIKYSTTVFTFFSSTESYSVEFSTSRVMPNTNVKYTVGGLNPGTTYYFGIITRDDANNWSTWIKDEQTNTANYSFATDLPPPPPSNITISGINKEIELMWSNPSPAPGDIEKYWIYQATFSFDSLTNENIVHIATVSYPSVNKTVTGLTNGVRYYYRIKSLDKGDQGNGLFSIVLEGELSNEVSAIPRLHPPTNLFATHNGTSVSLTWSHSVDYLADNFNGYNIYRAETSESDSYILVGKVSATENNFVDTQLAASKTYYYIVRSLDTDGIESVDSNIATAAPDLIAPEFVLVEKLTSRSLGKPLVRISLKVVDDRIVKDDREGKIVSLVGKFRKINDTLERDITFVPEVISGASEYLGEAEFDFSILQIGTEGIEYYLVAKDEVNISSWPANGSWYRVELPMVLPEQKFISVTNPEMVFGQDAEEVIIRDYSGNELWKGSSNGGTQMIIWRGEDKQNRKIESGGYIYEIKTKDGKKKFGIAIIVK